MHAPSPISLRRKLPLPLAGEVPCRIDQDHVTEGVYERLKAWLMSQALVPGQLLQIGVLAEELGVSTTPVREALTRLAAERIIISAPKRGFFARTPSDEEMRGLYCVSQAVLDASAARVQSALECDGTTHLADQPPASSMPSHERIAARTADLFIRIATASGLAELTAVVRNVNDRLHHARLIERELIEGADQELTDMARLFHAGKIIELRAALERYHAMRIQYVAAICKELLLRSFLSQR